MHSPPKHSPKICYPGCVCKKGYVWDSVGKICVKSNECPCHHGGVSYTDGRTIQEDCNTWCIIFAFELIFGFFNINIVFIFQHLSQRSLELHTTNLSGDLQCLGRLSFQNFRWPPLRLPRLLRFCVSCRFSL